MLHGVTLGEFIVAALQVAASALAAMGAYYAMKAARASLVTSRDATRALALALRPDVFAYLTTRDLDGEPRIVVTAQAGERGDATNVVIEVVRHDGARQKFRTDRLIGWTQNLASVPGINLGWQQPLDPNPQRDNGLDSDLFESVSVTFSDAQGLGRWSRRYRVTSRGERASNPNATNLVETDLVQVALSPP